MYIFFLNLLKKLYKNLTINLKIENNVIYKYYSNINIIIL